MDNARRIGRKTGSLSAEELRKSHLKLIKLSQQDAYPREIILLKNKAALPLKCALRKLTPFLDENSILRLGGRLNNSQLSEAAKHPIILSPTDHLTKLIVQYYHIANLHAGPTLLIYSIRQRYWIPSIRRVVSKILRKCLPCFRLQARPANQIMGLLPIYRIQPVARPFLNVGVDFAGPIFVISKTGRGRQIPVKGYCVIFVCLATKASHLELASDLTSETFIAAFKRFISRRGKPSQVYSDCGTNFVGASKILKDNERFESYIANESITWNFNPPAAPHFGGLWEACVKSTKYHLKRVLGETKLTFEEYMTLLCQVEACLNSRPLSPISEDPDTIDALTPGHFLVGSPLNLLPEPNMLDENISPLKRWSLIQKKLQDFWRRWSFEYIQSLQEAKKWTTITPNLKAGDLVLIREGNLPLAKWRLGKIMHTHPGADGHVRVVTIKHRLDSASVQ